MEIPIITPDGKPVMTNTFERLGGQSGVRKLVDYFYDFMDQESQFKRLRDLHAPELTEAREKLYLFLCGWTGGPPLYHERFGHPFLRKRHLPFKIGQLERDQWLACMDMAMRACQLDEDLHTFLTQRFFHTADFMRNQAE